MKHVLSFLFIISLLTACTPTISGPEPEIVSHSYAATDAPILNPERGFFTPYLLPGNAGFSPVRITGNTLVHLNIRLDDYRERDIPQNVLDGLDVNFQDIRDAGVKAIPRVAYNQGPYPDTEPDASKAWVLRHIEQLAPLFQKHSDVIAWVEAGFIGAWGEWHTSTNGLDNLADKRDILNALLAAIPGRYVQVRYPANIIEMYPEPQDAAKAFVAHHNDCFLSSATDVGTYERDGENTIERDQEYLAKLTMLTPMSGESCAPFPPRSECNSAIREMELLHFSAINEAYHKGILRSWEAGGCMDEIVNRLGYRLSLTRADFNEQVRPGGLLNLKVEIENTGFSAPVNSRPIFIVLQQDASIFLTTLDPLEPRVFHPGTSSFTARLRLPSGLAEGTYHLALWLPDQSESLQNNSLYAIRFANENTWDEATGYNILGQVNVSNSASGSVEKTEFLTVLEMVGGLDVPLPTATAAPLATLAPTSTPQPSDPISGLKADSDSEYLNLEFTFTGALEDYNAFQLFLDTDQNPATGFSVSGLGADFLLENGLLNAYTGSGSDWNWMPLENEIVHLNDEQAARSSVLLADLGNPKALDFAAQLVDTSWNTVFASPKQAITLP